jgi:hypothetical protein
MVTMSTEIPSEIFGPLNSYAIFIDRKAANAFKEFIKTKTSWTAVEVLNANFDDNLSVIVIPLHNMYIEMEKELFEFKNFSDDEDVKKSGFWGQTGIGYKGKTWSV